MGAIPPLVKTQGLPCAGIVNIAIMTDFINYDPSYSLCGVVANQCKLLNRNGLRPRLLVRHDFHDWHTDDYEADLVKYNSGVTGGNVVNYDENSEQDIENLVGQFDELLAGIDLVMTHDLLWQPNLWKQNIAARRWMSRRGHPRWLHWIHSNSSVQSSSRNKAEALSKFPNSQLVCFHPEEIERKRRNFNFDTKDVVLIPNPIDVMENYLPQAQKVILNERLWEKDIIAVYPVRLDRGKQPHIVCEIFECLAEAGYKAKVVIVDFHSVDGPKADYRNEMKDRFGDIVCFACERDGLMPHQAVMNLFEYGDVLVHPSKEECDPLIIQEALWQRCGLVLNFDLPVFRQYDGQAVFGKFSSNIDVHTGERGETTTAYGNRKDYMRTIAGQIAYQMRHNPVLAQHARVRKERSLESMWQKYWELIHAS